MKPASLPANMSYNRLGRYNIGKNTFLVHPHTWLSFH